jgi:hypothetical protein
MENRHGKSRAREMPIRASATTSARSPAKKQRRADAQKSPP